MSTPEDSSEDDEGPTCPNCGQAVGIVTTAGPGHHVVGPCGCRVGHIEI